MGSRRKVHPFDASFSSAQPEEDENGILQVFLDTYHNLVLTWNRSQIGNRSHYSVERLLAFRDYYNRTSTTRVLAVCILYPVPAFLTMFLVECIPLNDPAEGWKANSALWVRMLLSAFFISAGMVFQARAAIESGVISSTKTIGVAIISAIYYTGLSMTIASCWKFPIPFGLVIIVTPFVTFVNTTFVLCIGPRVVMGNSQLRKQLLAHLSVASSQFLLVIVYPVFNAIFIRLSGTQQALFVMVLPTIKFVLKQTTACASTHLQERVGGVIVFNVNVFNVLYVAMCMQTAQSVLTTVFLVASDGFHIALALRTIYYHTNSIHEERKRGNAIWKLQNPVNYLEGMPAMIRAAFDKAPRAHSKTYEQIRVFAPFQLSVSDESMVFLKELSRKRELQMLSTIKVSSSSRAVNSGPSLTDISQQLGRYGSKSDTLVFAKSTQTIPTPNGSGFAPTASLFQNLFPTQDVPVKPPIQVKRTQSKRRKSVRVDPSLSSRLLLANLRTNSESPEEAVREGLQALFHCEYVILAEYVECALPLLYAVYLAGLFHLPTAAYYPHTRNLSQEKMSSTLSRLAVYGLLECGSFIFLHLMLKRRFGYSPMYQLAFVLETEAATLQSLLFGWIIFTLQLTLVHFGVDINVPLS